MSRLFAYLVVSLGVLLGACSDEGLPVTIEVESEEVALEWTAADLESDLERSGVENVERGETPACADGRVQILLLGVDSSLPAQTLAIDHSRCGEGHRFELRGGSLLSAQWAAYELMRQLGVRYFHPEQTYYPPAIEWPDSDLSVEDGPSFRVRVFGVHRTHPIELSPPLEPDVELMTTLEKRWIDWNVKIKSNQVNAFGEEYVGTYAYDRGFPRTTGFNLLNSQQGGRPILDPDDPRSEEEQIAEAIDAQMAPKDGYPSPSVFSTQFNPSEFTEADDQDTVRRLTFFSTYLSNKHPDVEQLTVNHGTAGSTTAHYGVRFFDLSQFAPPALEVELHTLMFYGLDRPAPVYGNQDFAYLLDFAQHEGPKRRIHYFPEGSWWLTFDLPVPLYLAPVTLEARSRDFEILRDMLSENDEADHGVYGHRLFSSGQEWGYWLIDWCVAHMTWDVDLGQAGCLERFTEIFAGGDEVGEIFAAVAADQAVHMRDPEVIRYLVGSDRETELAFDAGIVFHPLPPGPEAILGWTDEQITALESRSLEPLRSIARRYHAWANRLDALVEQQSPSARPWLEEIRDGIRIYALRAEHSVSVYETAEALRGAIAKADLGEISAAAMGIDRAKAFTEAAQTVVQRRESAYRYPESLTIAGDEPGEPGAIENRTIYPYRYLGRTHRMFYWKRPNEQLEALFGGGVDRVRVERRVLPITEAMRISLLETPLNGVRIEFSDGDVRSDFSPKIFANQGFFDWSLNATLSTGVLHYEDQVAVVERRFNFAKGSLEVVEPSGADVLNGLLPGLVLGLGDDGSPFMALGRIDGRGSTAESGSLVRRSRTGASSPAQDWNLELPDVGTVSIRQAELELVEGERARMLISGRMQTQEVIDLLVSVGGFEGEGARKIVAETLGYTPETLPIELPFRILATGRNG